MRVVMVMFGAFAQVIVGMMLVALTTYELIIWWVPNLHQIFIVSMEALYFAAYAIIATGLAVLWLDKRTPGPKPDTVGSSQREQREGASRPTTPNTGKPAL